MNKRKLEAQEEKEAQKKSNQLNAYREKMIISNTYIMECPYCNEALSTSDIKKGRCLHCFHDLHWNVND